MGATIGYGGDWPAVRLHITLRLKAAAGGTVTNNLVRENYFQVTLSLSYREVLYSKGRKY